MGLNTLVSFETKPSQQTLTTLSYQKVLDLIAVRVYTPGVNTTQRILKYLSEQKIPIKKAIIAREVQASTNTVATSLADLTRDYHVKQSKGYYSITPKGREELERDPLLTNFAYKKPTRSAQITITLPTQAIENSRMCRSIITQMSIFLDDELDDEYLPFVLIWLRKNGYTLPIFNFKDDAASQELLIKAMELFYFTLRGNNSEPS